MFENYIENEFYSILCEVAYGFQSKCKEYEKRRKETLNGTVNDKCYVSDEYLIRSLNKLYVFALKYNCVDKDGVVIAPNDETDAIENYFGNVLGIWIKRWEQFLGNKLEEFYETEAFISSTQSNKFIITETCDELALECGLYNRDAEQYKLFKSLRRLEQDAYVFCREFLIGNRIINGLKLDEFKRGILKLKVSEKEIDKIINLAYEKIPDDVRYICFNCGWTVSEDREKRRKCIDWRCRKGTNDFSDLDEIGDTRLLMRLKPGVMRYVSIPGKLELEIEKYCLRSKIKSELWPHKDCYDLKIYLKDGSVVAVDAKDYKDAFVLAYNLIGKERLFGVDDWDYAYIVVPDDVIERKFDYCQVVNNALTKVHRRVKCILYSDLLKIIGGNEANE